MYTVTDPEDNLALFVARFALWNHNEKFLPLYNGDIAACCPTQLVLMCYD